VEQNNINPPEIVISSKTTKRESRKNGNTFSESVQLFKQGLSIEEIAQQRGLASSTIIGHLAKAYASGEDIDIDQLIPKDKEAKIIESFEKFGLERIGPVKVDLGENFTYGEVNLVQAKLLRGKTI
jgi:ATP-dependent DNA helicase RecQ